MQEYATIESYSLSRLTNFSNVRAVIFLLDLTDAVIGRLEFLAANVPPSLAGSRAFEESARGRRQRCQRATAEQAVPSANRLQEIWPKRH